MRNMAKGVPSVVKLFEQLGTLFANVLFVIVENDSTDGTDRLLKDAAAKNDRLIVISLKRQFKDTKGAMHLCGLCYKRFNRMGELRNMLLDEIIAVVNHRQQVTSTESWDYITFIDLDLVHTGGAIVQGALYPESAVMTDALGTAFAGLPVANSHAPSPDNFDDGFDVMCANGVKASGRLRDALAYRDHVNGFDNTLKNQQQSRRAQNLQMTDRMLVPVQSCFGGLAIYRFNALMRPDDKNMTCRYPTTMTKQNQDCEHVKMHQCMIKNGFDRIYINPLLTAFYEPVAVECHATASTASVVVDEQFVTTSAVALVHNSSALLTKDRRPGTQVDCPECPIITPKSWKPVTTCKSQPASYFAAATISRLSPSSMSRMFLPCSGGVMWVRAGTVKKQDMNPWVNTIGPTRKNPFVLITTDGDNDMPSSVAHKEMLLKNPHLCGWYTQNYDGTKNTKLFPIPIGFDFHTPGRDSFELMRALRASFQPKRIIGVAIDEMSLSSHRSRAIAISAAKTTGCVRYKQLPKMKGTELHKEYRKYAFGLAPRGRGIDAHRTWEMLYLGMVPITLHSSIDELFDGLPVVLLHRWSDLCTLNLEKIYERLKELLPVPLKYFVCFPLGACAHVHYVLSSVLVRLTRVV